MNDLPHDWIGPGWTLAFGVAYRILHDVQLAEDVAQNTIMKAHRLGRDYFRSREHFMNWVATTARNDAIDILRKRGREILTDDPDATSSGSGPLVWGSGADLAEVVAALIEALTPIERKVLNDFYSLGKTLQQIGHELGCSIANVHKIRRRAEAKCRRVLEEYEVDPDTRLYHLRELLAWLDLELTPPETDDEDQERPKGHESHQIEPDEKGLDEDMNEPNEQNRDDEGETP